MDSIYNALQKESAKLWNLKLSTIGNIIDRIQLNLSNRSKKKELRQFEVVLNDINSTFLNSYGYKYGYVRPGILSDINLEVLKRLNNKSKSQMDDFKLRVTAKGLTYLLIYQTCISLMNSYNPTNSSGDNPNSETLLDLIQFSLNGLNREKLKGTLGGQ